MLNCCNNSTRCSQCNRYMPNCSWYTYPQYRINQPFIYRPVAPQTQTIPSIGYFTATGASVAAAAPIPLVLNRIIGSNPSIISSTNGITIQPGVYSVNYSVTASGEDGASVAVALNGTILPQLSQSSATASTNQNVSNAGVIQVSSPNSILTLVNNSAATMTVANANLMVTKIS